MTLIMPDWASQTYRVVRNMSAIPIGCTPYTTYLLFRAEVLAGGEPERRCRLVLDFWGADQRWHSPQLGTGIYRGLCNIPAGNEWLASQYALPDAGDLVLIYVPDLTHAVHHPVLRGLYLGQCDKDDAGNHQWRVRLDWLGRTLPAERRSVRIMDRGDLLWLPLPCNEASHD